MSLGWADENDPPAVATVDLPALLDQMSQAFDRVRRASELAGEPVTGARILHRAALALNHWGELLERLARHRAGVDVEAVQR